MQRWHLLAAVGFVALFSLTLLLTGQTEFLLVAPLLLLIVGTFGVVQLAMSRRVAENHGSVEDAMSASSSTIPSAHLIPDDETAAGDTPEAHDEINPHDLPVDARGRIEAERQAAEHGGVTRGHEDPTKPETSGQVEGDPSPDAPEPQPSNAPPGLSRPVV